jgi:hypothetical protein
MREKRCIQSFGGETGRKRPLGRPRHRWDGNITIYHLDVGWRGKDWTDLSQSRERWRALAKAMMKLQFPHNSGKCLSS